MPTTQTLLPNGTRSGAGDFTVTGATLIRAASARACLASQGWTDAEIDVTYPTLVALQA